ncbi:MAG: efflux RND transporter periplasmic adaptor subunit [Saprospiraceae bacterium]|nr:efflux RND transporter periplasmic adaptor subunit [Saprospiraceae bacterium]
MKNLFLWVALLTSLSACKKKKDVVHAEYEGITQSVYASGVIKSRNQYQVYSSVAGLIEKLFVTEGAIVKRGQPILQITNATAQLQKDNSEIAANFNALQNNAERLQELSYNIDLARQKKETDSSIYARQLSLWQQNIGSRIELEQRELAAQNAKIAYENTLLRYRELKKQLDFVARQSQMSLAITSAQTRDLQIKSEISGKVFSLMKKQGEMVTAQSPIAIIGESDNFYLDMQIDEYDIAQIRQGQKVVFSMDSYRGQVFEAIVSKIYPIMNERSKTFTVEAELLKKPNPIYPNLTAEANIVILSKEKALLIPRSILIDEEYVILENGEKRKVQIGLKDYQKVEILSGITENDALLKSEQ